VLHFGHIVGLSVFQNLGDTQAKDSLEKDRLLGKFTAKPKPPSNAVADARGSAKGGDSSERKPPRSTNAVFWLVPGDLLGDASNDDNALAFKHSQIRA
jgi:hypothetical protein